MHVSRQADERIKRLMIMKARFDDDCVTEAGVKAGKVSFLIGKLDAMKQKEPADGQQDQILQYNRSRKRILQMSLAQYGESPWPWD